MIRRNHNNSHVDDADVAAGNLVGQPIESAPSSIATINTSKGHPMDLEFFEDLVSEPVLVLGMDISHFQRQTQFIVCATGVFGFSLLYGYLQELISVQLCNRKLGLFQAVSQFTGYTVLAYALRNFVYLKQKKQQQRRLKKTASAVNSGNTSIMVVPNGDEETGTEPSNVHKSGTGPPVPLILYLGLSLLRAVDLAMTNLAMQYINYPAKTLMKSSRVVFTMLFGVVISRKTYHTADYFIVMCMVAGLALFMHADANSSAVFHYMGVSMLTVSLICDGAISNVSETIMNRFGVGQDEFIFRMYSIALVAIMVAAAVKGDLQEGLYWLQQPGTYDEVTNNVPLEDRTWSVPGKIVVMVLFSSMGFFGSSCSAAITKNFGALTMSITSTARKATTLFLSFFLFNNVCTAEHLAGVVMFITALTAKSLRRRRHRGRGKKSSQRRPDASDPKNSATGAPTNDWVHGLMMMQSRQKKQRRKQQQQREGEEEDDSDHRQDIPLAVDMTLRSRRTDRPLIRRNSRDGPENTAVRSGGRKKKNQSSLVHIV